MSSPSHAPRPRLPLRAWLPPAIVAPLAATWWWRTGHWSAALIAGVSCALLAIAWVAPRIHTPLQRILDRIAHAFLQIATWLVLGLVFALVFVPGRLVLSLLRRDALSRRRDPTATTYFETPPPASARRFTEQF